MSRHFVETKKRGQGGLASALRAGIGVHHSLLSSPALCRGSMNGQCKLRWLDLRDKPEDDILDCTGIGLFRSSKQPDGCAPLGRTSYDGRSALPQHCVPGLVYSAHAGILTAALRGGMLRMTASRPCLSTACRDWSSSLSIVIPGLVPGIHERSMQVAMAGSSGQARG